VCYALDFLDLGAKTLQPASSPGTDGASNTAEIPHAWNLALPLTVGAVAEEVTNQRA